MTTILLLSIGLVAARELISAAIQTRTYYKYCRLWLKLWPFNRGKGLPRIVRPLLKPFVPVWVRLEPQVSMLLDDKDLISRVILETGSWDQATWNAIKDNLTSGAIFVDVGAHAGYCSLKAAALVGPGGRVIAFEPNPEMARELRNNVLASGATRVEVIEAACTDSTANVELFVAHGSNTGSSSICKKNASLGGPIGKIHHVNGQRLDDVINVLQLSRVDVIKIDVEGSELLVLRGARATIQLYRPIIIIELDDLLLAPMGVTTATIVDFLGALGYSLSSSFDQANFEFRPNRHAIGTGSQTKAY